MSWRGAAELARQWAADSRRLAEHLADRLPTSGQERLRAFEEEDKPLIGPWLERRIAQAYDRLANECQRRSSMEDVTVVSGPGTKR